MKGVTMSDSYVLISHLCTSSKLLVPHQTVQQRQGSKNWSSRSSVCTTTHVWEVAAIIFRRSIFTTGIKALTLSGLLSMPNSATTLPTSIICRFPPRSCHTIPLRRGCLCGSWNITPLADPSKHHVSRRCLQEREWPQKCFKTMPPRGYRHHRLRSHRSLAHTGPLLCLCPVQQPLVPRVCRQSDQRGDYIVIRATVEAVN
jgi:hypothetical protein